MPQPRHPVILTYRSYLLAELENEQPENQLRAVERLGQIIYWGEDIDNALARLKDHEKAEVRDAAEKAQQERVRVASQRRCVAARAGRF